MKATQLFLPVLSAILLMSSSVQTSGEPPPTFDVLLTFDYPGATSTYANAINEEGDVAGVFSDNSGSRGFVRFRHGRFGDPIIEPNDTDGYTAINGLNNMGTLSGTYLASDQYHAFLATDAIFTEIVTGAYHTVAGGVNDAGNFCGQTYDPYVGFVNIGETMTSFTIPGSYYTFVRAINNLNQSVGYYGINYTYVGFFRDADGTLTFPISAPHSQYTFLYGINDKGMIVGEVWDATGEHGVLFPSLDHAVLYDYPGARTTSFSGINKRGLICGSYSEGPNYHAFIVRVKPAARE